MHVSTTRNNYNNMHFFTKISQVLKNWWQFAAGGAQCSFQNLPCRSIDAQKDFTANASIENLSRPRKRAEIFKKMHRNGVACMGDFFSHHAPGPCCVFLCCCIHVFVQLHSVSEPVVLINRRAKIFRIECE